MEFFYHKPDKNLIANHRSDRGHFEGNIGEGAWGYRKKTMSAKKTFDFGQC
jgi:hypothetical protein